MSADYDYTGAQIIKSNRGCYIQLDSGCKIPIGDDVYQELRDDGFGDVDTMEHSYVDVVKVRPNDSWHRRF